MPNPFSFLVGEEPMLSARQRQLDTVNESETTKAHDLVKRAAERLSRRSEDEPPLLAAPAP